MGVVYKAFDPFFEREVAIKTVSAELSQDSYFRERFFREARSTGKLKHPNIITVHDLGEEQGRPYLVMEYLEGYDLKSEISALRHRTLEQKIRIMVEICSGLSCAHKTGITHRDIKPGNLFVLDSGQVKILDFGLARLVSSESMTTKASLMGTPFYMAPEQWGNKKVDHRSDIFAAGAVFYELLTYQRAFDGETYETIFNKIFHCNTEPLGKVNPAIPAELSQIVLRMLEKSPDDRYQQMDDVIRDLEAFGASLEERKRAMQVQAAAAIGRLEQLLREHKELLELGPARPDDATMIDMSLLGMPAEGAASPPVWQAPEDYLGIFDVSQQASRNYELLSALVEKRKRALSLLREVAMLRQGGQLDRALEILAEILREDPGHIRAATLHKELSDQLEALKLEEQSALRAEELFQEAAAKFASGDVAICARLLQRVIELEPENKAALELREGVRKIVRGRAEAALIVAKNTLAMGSLARARERMEIARNLDPETAGLAQLVTEIERAESLRQEKTPSVPPLGQEAAAAAGAAAGPPDSAPVRDESVDLLERVRLQLGKRIETEEKKRERVATLLGAARDAISLKQFAKASRTLDEILKTEADRSDVMEMRRQTLAYLDSEKAKAEGDREKQAGLELIREKRFTEALESLRHAAELLGEDSSVARAIVEAEAELRREGPKKEGTDPAVTHAPIPPAAPRPRLPRVVVGAVVVAGFALLIAYVAIPQVREWQTAKAFEGAIKDRRYYDARDALLGAPSVNPADPKTAERWGVLNSTFSPEFADDFLGALEFWTAPGAWRTDSGKLIVKGPGFGVVRNKYYEDFDEFFDLSFINRKGAVWILRSGRDGGSHYLFQLTGPAGKAPNSFAAFKYVKGQVEKILGPVPVPADLSLPNDQFHISIKAEGTTITSSIEPLSAPRPEPLLLGTVNDPTCSAGTLGFGTKDDEEFIVGAFKIIPIRKTQ